MGFGHLPQTVWPPFRAGNLRAKDLRAQKLRAKDLRAGKFIQAIVSFTLVLVLLAAPTVRGLSQTPSPPPPSSPSPTVSPPTVSPPTIPSPNPSSPALPSPVPREALIQRIQDQAKRDLEVGRLQRPEDVRKLFAEEAKQVGVPAEAIDQTYDDAYAKAKDAKETDPQEVTKVFKDWRGWLAVVFLSAIFAFFKDSVLGSIKQITTAINTWIYQRFAGTKLFWNFAISKYRKALVAKHQELKIPFRPNRPLAMAEVYVPLKVVDSHPSQTIASSRTSGQIEAIKAVTEWRRLMVKGQPGSGKSMLLKFLALNYGLGRLPLPEDPVVILLELHRLSDASLSLEQQLVNALERDDFPNGLQFVRQSLQQGRVLLLLDGLDEVNSIDRPPVVRRLKDFLDQHEKCRVVITCRTQVYQGEFDDLVNRTLEVVEFSDRQIRQFLSSWKSSMPPEKSVEQLLQTLRDRPRIVELARNPLLLTIIAYLYADTTFVLPHSRAEFYQQSTNILLESWDQAKQTPNRYKGFTKRLVLQHLALFAQDSAGQQGSDRKTIPWQEVLEQVKAVLPGLNLDATQDAEPLLDELVERSGLLLRIDGGARYQFTHLTLQEFFAAAQLVDQPQDLIQRFQQDQTAWQEVVKLWCGLAKDSSQVILQVYKIQPVMAFECLADAQQVAAQLADQMIAIFQQRLTREQPDQRLIQAFGAVAADTRPRGKALFGFLETLFTTTSDAQSQRIAVQALSYTNLPQAAQVLAKLYPGSMEICQALIQLGDLAVPHLRQYRGTHQGSLVEDLFRIGTPDAAKALVEFLWNSDATVAATAALYLTVMLPEPDIATAMNSLVLTRSQKQSCDWDWIWDPFATPPNSALPKLAARMADLLTHHPTHAPIPDLPEADLRIMIPVCAFSKELRRNLPQTFPPEAKVLMRSTGNSGALRQRQSLPIPDSLLPSNSQELNWSSLLRLSPSIQDFDSTDLQQQQLQVVNSLLPSASHDSIWRALLATMSPSIQLDLLRRLINNRQPTTQDWRDLFRPVRYDFQTSWHYYGVLLTAAIVSVIALVEIVYLLFQSKDLWTSWLLGLPIVVLVDAWLFLWQGIEAHLEPMLFLNFGVWGWINFGRQMKRLIQDQIVWDGIGALFEIVTSNQANATVFAGAVLVAIAGAGNAAVAGAGGVAGAVAVAVVSAGWVAIAGAVAGSQAGAFVAAVAFTLAVIVTVVGAAVVTTMKAFDFVSTVTSAAAVSLVLAVGVAIAVGVAVIGIGFWRRAKKKEDGRRYWAVLALPFFCSAPIVVVYATLGLFNFWDRQTIALFWLIVISVCTALWQRGQYLDRRARNPLQGLIPNPTQSSSRPKRLLWWR